MADAIHFDIKSAFLHSHSTDSDIFESPNKVWKLNTTIYRLTDAPHSWDISIDNKLSIGVSVCKLNPSEDCSCQSKILMKL